MKECNSKQKRPTSLRELEHEYFRHIVEGYLERNAILKYEFTYDKRKSETIDDFLVYDPNSDCPNDKIKFIELDFSTID